MTSVAISREERAAQIRSSIFIDEFGCWLWTGQRNPEGYGVIGGVGAHRVSYEAFVGRIPHLMCLDHICHRPEHCVCGPRCLHRRCLNPAHMEIVTPRENWLRGQLGQRYLARLSAA